ncbi:MAG: DUF1476 domain-containing protein [Thermaurantiacus sp.]
MTTLKDRGEGFENKFAHDAETEFRINARRNRLLGLWAAEKLKLEGDAAEAYAREVVQADFEEVGDADVVRKVMGDFATAGVLIGEPELREVMAVKREEARAQILAG